MKVFNWIKYILRNKKFQINDKHYLEYPVKIINSPNCGGEFIFPVSPFYVVLHYTATYDTEYAIRLLTDPKIEASAHLVISRNGDVTQLVPFNREAWHAGKSEWKGISSINKYSIGIEIVNAGKLDLLEGEYLTWDKKLIPAEEVEVFKNEQAEESYWHRYTEIQVKVLEEIIPLLKKHYNFQEILMHSEISPDRKIDPGPVFPISTLRNIGLL